MLYYTDVEEFKKEFPNRYEIVKNLLISMTELKVKIENGYVVYKVSDTKGDEWYFENRDVFWTIVVLYDENGNMLDVNRFLFSKEHIKELKLKASK